MQTGQSGAAAGAARGAKVEPVAIVAQLKIQLFAGIGERERHAGGVTVFEYIGQRFLQQPQQVEAACRSKVQAVEVLQGPADVDIGKRQTLAPAAT